MERKNNRTSQHRQDPDRRRQDPERRRSGGLQDSRQDQRWNDPKTVLLHDLLIEQAGAVS